jgi:hypothetical protein
MGVSLIKICECNKLEKAVLVAFHDEEREIFFSNEY